MKNSKEIQKEKMIALAFIPIAIALNVGIGAIVKGLGLPLYLDSIGTILTTILLGWKKGAIVGVIGFILTSLVLNPFAIYFIGTQVVIALFTHFVGRKSWLKNIVKVIISGIGLGIVSAIASAPVITYVFKGATGNGAALVTSFFAKMGNQILESVLLSGISIEPIDKTIQIVLVFFILKSIPKILLASFTNGSLKENNFID